MKTLVWSSSAIPATPEQRATLRPIARDPEWYQRMLTSCQRIAVWCDELGYDGVVGLEGWASDSSEAAVERFRVAFTV